MSYAHDLEHFVQAMPPGLTLWCILKVAVRRFAAPADREKRNHHSSNALGDHPHFRARSSFCLLCMNTSTLYLLQQFTSDQKRGGKMARNWPWSMALIYYRLLCKVIPALYLTQ